MKKLNNYIVEAWSGVKQQSLKSDIEAWCDEMGIRNYTINSKGEIDVDGDVYVFGSNKKLKELPYKFGSVTGYFNMGGTSLTSCKNFPNDVLKINISGCKKIKSLEGIGDFYELHLGDNMIEDFYPLNTINYTRFKDKQGVYGSELTKLKTMDGLPKEMEFLKLTNCPNLEILDYSILPKLSKGLELRHNHKITDTMSHESNIDMVQLTNAVKLRANRITIY